MPKSACTEGNTTTTTDMPKLPSAQITTLAARRHQAYRESTPSMISRRPSTANSALCIHIEGVERVTGRHEQAVAVTAAEADVGAALGQVDMADRLALGTEDTNAVEFVAAHSPAAPQIAVDIDAEAVG